MSQTVESFPTLLDRAEAARVVLEPYPHIVIENALPQDAFETLCAAFPAANALPSHLAGANNKRFNLYSSWGPTELPPENVPEAWRGFLAAHSSPAFARKVFDLFPSAVTEGASEGERWLRMETFGEGLSDMLGLRGPVRDTDIVARTTVAVNTPCSAPTSVRGPHVDSRWKAYVGLFYVRAAEDDSVGGDLDLFRWKPGAKVDPWTMKADPSAVEAFATVRYAPNTYVLMLNTHDSLHGVTVRQPTPHVRRFAVTSGWFPGVDEKGLLGRRKGVVERLKDIVRPLVRQPQPSLEEYQD